MSAVAAISETLRRHMAVCQQTLAFLERESRSVHRPLASSEEKFSNRPRELSFELQQSTAELKKQRAFWEKLTPAERKDFPEVPALIQQCQTIILRIVTLVRENEQAQLRRGLLSSSSGHPPAAPRPHFVSELYRRNTRP